MTKEILTRITIPAHASDVWATLTDFAAYAAWNPFIQRIEGRCEPGARLHITLRKPSGKRYTFTATVTASKPGRLLQWQGTLAGMPWLFSGVHTFELLAESSSTTELVNKECFSGLLSSPVLAGIRTDTERGFTEMNIALSSRVRTPTPAGA